MDTATTHCTGIVAETRRLSPVAELVMFTTGIGVMTTPTAIESIKRHNHLESIVGAAFYCVIEECPAAWPRLIAACAHKKALLS